MCDSPASQILTVVERLRIAPSFRLFQLRCKTDNRTSQISIRTECLIGVQVDALCTVRIQTLQNISVMFLLSSLTPIVQAQLFIQSAEDSCLSGCAAG